MTEPRAGLSAMVLGALTLSGVNEVLSVLASVSGLIIAAPHVARRVRSLWLKIKS